MKKVIGVITTDDYLFRKISLTLKGTAETKRAHDNDGGVYDLLLVDKECSSSYGEISMSRKEECDLPIPFTYAELLLAVGDKDEMPLTISKHDRCAILKGKKIRLTELEFSLLSYLFNAGRQVSKSELLSEVWEGSANEGIVNVYIHYLREKLEAGGEKVIVCSRKYGYGIDKKYLIGGRNADTD